MGEGDFCPNRRIDPKTALEWLREHDFSMKISAKVGVTNLIQIKLLFLKIFELVAVVIFLKSHL
jgi:hypothetical protein